MANLRQLLDKLPIDDALIDRLPTPGGSGDCILEIDAARGFTTSAPASPVEAFSQRSTPFLGALVEGLRAGARDEQVKGLIVHAAAPRLPLAQAEELRSAVAAFRTGGKPTVAWAESFGDLTPGAPSYLLATACEEVWLQPTGEMMMLGASIEPAFFRQALDKLGVVPQAEGRKEYKSAAERFTRDSLSDPNRKQLQAVVDSVVEAMITQIAHARGLSVDAVHTHMDTGILSATAALEAGLIDKVGYRDEAYAAVRARVAARQAAATDDTPTGAPTRKSQRRAARHRPTQGESAKEPALRFVERYAEGHKDTPAVPIPGRDKNKRVVALLDARGAIHLGRAERGSFRRSIGSDDLGAALRKAATDEVAAVVLRVDSGGGSAVASDAIRREILRVREAGIRVIASMGSMAASGGYYIAMPADEIVASPYTITGSIGVISGKLVTHPALDRIGVTHDAVARGRHARLFSAGTVFDEEQWELIRGLLDRVYADFVDRAAHDRHMDRDRLESLARGRIWTGQEAHSHGLVDHLGGLDVALDRVAYGLGVRRDALDVQPSPKTSLVERFFPKENSDAVGVAASMNTVLGEGDALLDRALAALGLSGHGVLTAEDLTVR